jgi:hypothetical protein
VRNAAKARERTVGRILAKDQASLAPAKSPLPKQTDAQRAGTVERLYKDGVVAKRTARERLYQELVEGQQPRMRQVTPEEAAAIRDRLYVAPEAQRTAAPKQRK